MENNEHVLPERGNPTCLRSGSRGGTPELVALMLGRIVTDRFSKLQAVVTSIKIAIFAPNGISTGGALTRAELTSRSAARSASTQLCALCTPPAPKGLSVEGEQERPQTDPINSGSRLAVSRRTRRSVKTRADKQVVVIAHSSQGYTSTGSIRTGGSRPNYPF